MDWKKSLTEIQSKIKLYKVLNNISIGKDYSKLADFSLKSHSEFIAKFISEIFETDYEIKRVSATFVHNGIVKGTHDNIFIGGFKSDIKVSVYNFGIGIKYLDYGIYVTDPIHKIFDIIEKFIECAIHEPIMRTKYNRWKKKNFVEENY